MSQKFTVCEKKLVPTDKTQNRAFDEETEERGKAGVRDRGAWSRKR